MLGKVEIGLIQAKNVLIPDPVKSEGIEEENRQGLKL